MTILQQFDELNKHITTDKGREQAKEFRKTLKRSEKYANKLDTYFTLTHDGVEPERVKLECGL